MNILQVKKYCNLIKIELNNKLGLHIVHSVKHVKNKERNKVKL